MNEFPDRSRRARLAVIVWIAIVLGGARSSLASGPASPAWVIDAGTRVTMSGATRLTIDSDVLNFGTFLPSAGSAVVVNGYRTPRLLHLGALADLTIAKSGRVTLEDHTTVAGVLTLASGMPALAGHDLVANTIVGGSAASYVITPDTLGRLVRAVPGGTNVRFPVGNAGYDPLTVRLGAGSDVFRVAVLDAPPTAGLDPSTALTRAWAIAYANAPGANGAVTYAAQWNPDEQGPAFDRSLSPSLGAWAWRWLDGVWVPQANVRRHDNGTLPAVDTLLTSAPGLWTLAGLVHLLDAGSQPGAPPHALELAPASPNPFRGATTLRYGLPQRARVTLSLYSVLGERVVTLADGEQSAGWHVARLENARLASGVYFLRLQAGAETRTSKLVVTR